MKKNELISIVNSIEGWLSTNEAILLFNLAKSCDGKGVIVEIGSWKGKSTICLGLGSRSGGNLKIYAVDPHRGNSEHNKGFGKFDTFNDFLCNLKTQHLDDIVVPLRFTSTEASKIMEEPVQLIFIDGAHEYDMVKLDFEVWFPKLIVGGVMAFHDTVSHEGPRRVVEELLYKSHSFKGVKFIDSITFGTKISKNSGIDRIRNAYSLFMLKFRIYLAKKVRLPKWLKIMGKKVINHIQP